MFKKFDLDKVFLKFFFKRLKVNKSGRFAEDFPYISRCGPEINYVRCENKPIVYTDVVEDEKGGSSLVVNGIGDKLMWPFEPQKLCMLPRNGRVYHPAPNRVGGAGILKTSLAIEISSCFSFENGTDEETPPSHFLWKGESYKLENVLWRVLKIENKEDED